VLVRLGLFLAGLCLASLCLASFCLAADEQQATRNTFGRSLGQVLQASGLQDQRRPISEQQRLLINRMGDIFALDDDLDHEERQLLAANPVGKPTDQHKLRLKAISNLHVKNTLMLERLTAELAHSVAMERLQWHLEKGQDGLDERPELSSGSS